MKPSRLLPLAAFLVVLPALFKVPTLDEESYLWLGRQLDPTHPYSWTRSWPPYDPDGFVYAHPPLHLLWMWLVHGLPVPLQRLASGLVWAPLLGWGVGRLAETGARHPGLAAGLWLSSTVVVLGLQDSLMVDLPAAALVTAGLAVYRAAAASEDRREEALAGVLLGLAVATKYPMALVLPVVGAHIARRRGRWTPLVVALGIAVADELLIFLVYHRVHLWEVWTRRGEIAHGPLDARALGTLARAAFLPLPFLLFRTDPRTSVAGVALAGLALALVRPAGLSPAGVTALLLFCIAGGLVAARAGRALGAATHRRRKGDLDDGFLLGGVTLTWLLGVTLLHNYASTRYLLPAAGPLAILLTRSAEEVRGGKALARMSIVASAGVALAVALADYRYARAGWAVGVQAAAKAPTGHFAGEWSFRAAMEQAGWTRLGPEDPVEPGDWIAVVDNASPGAVDVSRWEPVQRIESDDRFPLRVNDLGRGASLYAETLGVLPLGWSQGHLEGLTLFRVPDRGALHEAPRPPVDEAAPAE